MEQERKSPKKLSPRDDSYNFQSCERDAKGKVRDVISGGVISPDRVVSIKSGSIVHCFDIDTLYRHWIDKGKKDFITNPFTNQKVEENIYRRVLHYGLAKERKFDVFTNISGNIDIKNIRVPYYKPVGYMLILIFKQSGRYLRDAIILDYLIKPLDTTQSSSDNIRSSTASNEGWSSLYDLDFNDENVVLENSYKNLVISSSFLDENEMKESLKKLKNYLDELSNIDDDTQNILDIVDDILDESNLSEEIQQEILYNSTDFNINYEGDVERNTETDVERDVDESSSVMIHAKFEDEMHKFEFLVRENITYGQLLIECYRNYEQNTFNDKYSIVCTYPSFNPRPSRMNNIFPYFTDRINSEGIGSIVQVTFRYPQYIDELKEILYRLSFLRDPVYTEVIDIARYRLDNDEEFIPNIVKFITRDI